MAPHPFREVNPIHEVSGQDCTRIPNVRGVGCSHSRCIVTSCQEGWITNANNTGCMVNLAEASGRLSKRSDPLSITVTANTVVDSEIVTRLVTVVDVVLHLSTPSSVSGANVTTTVSYGISLLNDINTATAKLVTSRTIRAFLQNIDHLLDISSLLRSWLDSCACVSGLGLTELAEEMNSLTATVTELQTYCSRHLVVSSPGSPTLTMLSPSATNLPEHPLVIRPSDLLSGLQLNGGVIIQGLHDSNSLLNVLGLGPDSPTPKIDSDLSNRITALVQLVIALQDDLTSLPLDGRLSSIDLNLFGQVAKVLLNATTVADIVAPLEQLVALSNDSIQILENCGCIDLQQLHYNLKHILGVALEALTWCHSQPVVPGSKTPSLANKTSGNVPVVVGLPDRLNHLSLDSSGLITLGGIGGVISNRNDHVGIDRKPRNIVDPNLLSCLEVLVNLVAKLHVSITLTLPSSQPCVGSAELGFVKEMVDSLTCITPSTTLADILISVNRILMAESSLEKALEICSDGGTTKDLVEVLVKITKVTLQLGDLCGSSKTTLIHHSTATLLPATSRSVRIVTSRSSHHTPTTTTPTVGSATETRPLPAAVPTRPSSSNNEIIVSLNHLLSTLGLGRIRGVIAVEGLGHELNDPVNMLLDDLQIGPHDLRRREIFVQNRLTHLTLQANVDALIDLFITLVGECGTRNFTNIGAPQRNFLNASLQQVVGVLTATSWSKFVGGLDRLTTGIVDALKLLDNCECIADRKLEGVYRYLTEVVDASLALQRLCQQVDMSDTLEVNGQPMVMGLTRLLKELAIERRSAAVLNGIDGGQRRQ